MKFVATIHVRPKSKVRDPQGDAAAAQAAAQTMGNELLANPVIENFSVDVRTA